MEKIELAKTASLLCRAAITLPTLCAIQVKADDHPTYGFTEPSYSIVYQWPYNLNLNNRHTGTAPGLEHFWVYNTDDPFMPGSPTSPRTEAETSPRWTSGVWQFEGDLMVPPGTSGVNVMQIFGADPSIGSAAFMLRTYDGYLSYNGRRPILIQNIYDQWIHVNVTHDDNAHLIYVYINNQLTDTLADSDNGTHPTHYFKYGVYQDGDNATDLTEDYWQNTKIWYAASKPVVPPPIPLLAEGFGGDTIPDAVLFDTIDQTWTVRFSNDGSLHTFAFGQGGTPFMNLDFDGDGQSDAVLFDAGNWAVRFSGDGSQHTFAFGQAGDEPLVVPPFVGDPQPDAVVFRPSDGSWHVRFSRDASEHTFNFGQNGDTPMMKGDFDGDGNPDAVTFAPSTGTWQVRFSSDASIHTFQFGQNGDIPLLAAPFVGDTQPDAVVFRPSDGSWHVRFSRDGSEHTFNFGQNGDVPIMDGDFDGDGNPDAVVYRPSDNTWYVRFSSDGSEHSFSF